jgi:heterodisulfide reductase subunit B
MKIMMREDDKVKKYVNEMLGTLNPPLTFNDTIDVFHLAEFFWKVKETVKDKVKPDYQAGKRVDPALLPTKISRDT